MRQHNHNYDPHNNDEYSSIRKEQVSFDSQHHGINEQPQQNKRNRLRAKVISPSKRFSRKTRFSLNQPVQIMYMQSTSSAYSSSSRPPQLSKDSSRHSRISSPQQYTSPYFSELRRRNQMELNISTGLTFDDGDQLLISAQKPLGIILEEREDDSMITSMGGCVVAEVVSNGEADKAGVKVGDILVAVQNQDVSASSLEDVMSRIGNAPRVVNLRFWRRER